MLSDRDGTEKGWLRVLNMIPGTGMLDKPTCLRDDLGFSGRINTQATSSLHCRASLIRKDVSAGFAADSSAVHRRACRRRVLVKPCWDFWK